MAIGSIALAIIEKDLICVVTVLFFAILIVKVGDLPDNKRDYK